MKKQGAIAAYSFKNDKAQAKTLASYKVSVDSVWRLSGLELLLTKVNIISLCFAAFFLPNLIRSQKRSFADMCSFVV